MAQVVDRFVTGPLPHWVRLAVGHAAIEWQAGCLRFSIEGAPDGQLSDAEIGDYRDRARSDLPWRPPLRMMVKARFSQPADGLRGTSGFGFWNNPFASVTGDVLAPPNALWFFCASISSDMVAAPGLPGNGFRAEMINGGKTPGWLLGMARWLLKVPGLTRLLYLLAQTRVHAGAQRLDSLQMVDWHEYALAWDLDEAVFCVDGEEVLRVSQPPALPLGFVAWMDNQVAVARPDGDFRFGLEAVPGRQYLELACVEIDSQ
jgi:hypothetical protein